MNMYMYEDDIHMNMPVEVTLECENKILEYNDSGGGGGVGERSFVPMLSIKQPYNYDFKHNKDRLRRGRKKNTYVQRTFFLFRHCDPDHFPTKKERIMLTAQGLGKKGPMNINRSWTMAEMDKQISDWYNIPMLSVMGFTYYKNDIRRKLIKLNIQCVDQLEREVPAGGLVLLVPNHDLPLEIRPNRNILPNGAINSTSTTSTTAIKCEIMDDGNNEENQPNENHIGTITTNGEMNNSCSSKYANVDYSTLESSSHFLNDNNKPTPPPPRSPTNNFKLNESGDNDEHHQYNSVTKGLKEEIFNLKLQLNSSKQMRASLELQLCRKEEIILKTSDQLAKANEELWRLKNFIKRLGCNSEVPQQQQQQQQNNEKLPQQNLNTTW